MKKLLVLSFFLAAYLAIPDSGISQTSGYGNFANKKIGVHSGNQVKTVFTNAGVIGQPSSGGPRGSWIYDNNGYIGDISLLIGVEAKMNTTHPQFDKDNSTIKGLVAQNGDSIYHSVIISDVTRPAAAQEDDVLGGPNFTFQPKPNYANPNQGSVAISTDRDTWPDAWPDKDVSYRGKWNGYFGAFARADQESYFVMDDHTDAEFNRAPFYHVPNSAEPQRRGMGLDVSVRGLQWAQFLAQDCIFWLYEIKNSSTTDYDKAIFGLICGTYVGVTGTDDSPQEYNDDASFFDVKNSLVYSWDFNNDNSRNPNWVGKEVGYVGYAFLESPGNPYDGIDNDRDAKKTSPVFSPADFDTNVVVQPGDKLVQIIRVDSLIPAYNKTIPFFKRNVITVGANPFDMTTLGMKSPVRITPGITKLSEGHVVKKTVANQPVKVDATADNAFDGIDNDFDGLIDENYFVHYRQYKLDQEGNVLFDEIVPAAFKNYKTGAGVTDVLIDERRDDGIDNDGDWVADFDDVGADGELGGTAPGEFDGIPTPGEPNFDALDVSESDQIGLTSFEYFAPANIINLRDDEKLWTNLRPGYFSVPTGFINGKPTRGEDGDFTFGSGMFPLLANQTERFSFALLYGSDLQDFYRTRTTVQTISDANYQFPIAPDKPFLKVVAGDRKVTLHWGRHSESSIDPVLKVKDFEGYKVYRSLDPNFNDIKVISDGTGKLVGYKPLAQFDIPKNEVFGYFTPKKENFQLAAGTTYYLGDDETGLAHSFVDETVTNGERYFYAVVAYDRGVDTSGIYPAENTKTITQSSSGEYKTDQNTAVVVPNVRSAGYQSESSFPVKSVGAMTTSKVSVKVVDESQLQNNNQYRVTFQDRRNDGIDNNGNGLIDFEDPTELIPVTTSYSVYKEQEETETIQADTVKVIQLTKMGQYIDSTTLIVRSPTGTIIPPAYYNLDEKSGRIIAASDTINHPWPFLPNKLYSFSYNVYPVYKSPYMANNPALIETNFRSNADDITFDGVTLSFENNWRRFTYLPVEGKTTKILIDSVLFKSESGFFGDTTSVRVVNFQDSLKQGNNFTVFTPLPNSYEITFSDQIIGKSIAGLGLPAKDTRFKIVNTATGEETPFLFFQRTGNPSGTLTMGDDIFILEKLPTKVNFNKLPQIRYTLDDSLHLFVVRLNISGPQGKRISLTNPNLTLKIVFSMPLNSSNIFEFTTMAPNLQTVSGIKEDMMKIRVVPNPYVVRTDIEDPLPPNVTSGRGERRIEFRHVPNDAKIYIFTTAGDLVRTLYADGSIFNGSVYWDLRTKENLDVAAGIYFYIIESKYGKKEGKIGVIK